MVGTLLFTSWASLTYEVQYMGIACDWVLDSMHPLDQHIAGD